LASAQVLSFSSNERIDGPAFDAANARAKDAEKEFLKAGDEFFACRKEHGLKV